MGARPNIPRSQVIQLGRQSSRFGSQSTVRQTAVGKNSPRSIALNIASLVNLASGVTTRHGTEAVGKTPRSIVRSLNIARQPRVQVSRASHVSKIASVEFQVHRSSITFGHPSWRDRPFSFSGSTSLHLPSSVGVYSLFIHSFQPRSLARDV